jgi:hypothetical protein
MSSKGKRLYCVSYRQGGVQQREPHIVIHTDYIGSLVEAESDPAGSSSWLSWTSALVELDQRAG